MRLPALLLSSILALSCAPATIPDSKLAAIPYEKKDKMRLAKEELDRADALQEQAKTSTGDSEAFLTLSKQELDGAEQDLDIAKTQKQMADGNGRAAEITIAQNNITLAEAKLAAAKAKVEYAKAARDYAKTEGDVAGLRYEAAAANYELVKLQILEENGGASGVDADKIRAQAQSTQQKYAAAEAKHADLKKRRDDNQAKYDSLQAKYEASKNSNPEAGKTPGAPTEQPGVLLPPSPTTNSTTETPPLKNPE